MIDPPPDKGEKVSTYTGNIRPAIVASLVIVVVHVVVMAIVIGVNEITIAFWVVNIFLFILYATLFGVMAYQAIQITITVYEKGIGWQRGTSHVFTTWDNIDAIGRKDEGDSTTFGLYLREPVQPEVHSWLDRRLFAAPVDYIRLIPTVTVVTTFTGLQGNMIDMTAFAETDFGKDVSRYAPQLLEG
jgi:hypothetical protein